MSKCFICTGILGSVLLIGCSEGATDAAEKIESKDQGLHHAESEHQAPHHSESKHQAPHHSESPVGLSLFFQNGVAQPIELVGNEARYLQEVDISEQVVTATDEGIDPLLTAEATKDWNWQGVHFVEEQYIPSLDGTFTRERYFRGAKWMEKSGHFVVSAYDDQGKRVGHKLIFQTGKDDKWSRADDGFIRRFDARQLALGCAAPGDCSGATFIAEALVQVRSATHPERRARKISPRATELRLSWTGDPHEARSVAVSHAPEGSLPYGYGFVVDLDPLSTPANGSFFEPGESVSFRLSFFDGSGHRLHPPGSLPTYADYISGGTESGLEYLNLQLPTRLYYALKHREANMMVGISGPLDQLQAPQTVVDPLTFFLPQTQFAFSAVDGYTSVIQTVPAAAIIFGGLQDPSAWSAPVSDTVTFTIPADAQAGTYVAVVKARRLFGGEALMRGATARLQVGQPEPTEYEADTSCSSCHDSTGTRLSQTLHGIGDRTTCFTCHSSLAIEYDNALDIRVHRIHALSDRFPADVNDCATCHLTTPDGPARGL